MLRDARREVLAFFMRDVPAFRAPGSASHTAMPLRHCVVDGELYVILSRLPRHGYANYLAGLTRLDRDSFDRLSEVRTTRLEPTCWAPHLNSAEHRTCTSRRTRPRKRSRRARERSRRASRERSIRAGRAERERARRRRFSGVELVPT